VDEKFIEDVLSAVEQIPLGQVASYGDIAELVGRGGPRQVGQVMARHGAAVAWWRVVRADGRPVRGLEAAAWERLSAEGVPKRGDRVDMAVARVRGAGFGATSYGP
jgi:alkylated DNA nucleotide flippase Atl1